LNDTLAKHTGAKGNKVRIVHINTWSVAPGKEQAVRQTMQESQKFLSKWDAKASRTIMLSMTGSQPGSQVTMITTWQSMEDWEKSMERRTNDAEWQAMYRKWAEVVVPATRQMTMHEVI
jgi:hypothetical protein